MRSDTPSETLPAPAIVVMGVSGSGKSTLASWLADALDAPFLEGDDYHPAANVAKMRGGHPLTDADRWPWLDRLGTAMAEAVRQHGRVVVACSALKRGYRARLAATGNVTPAFLLLDVDRDELARRLADRPGHYMPPSLLDSQLATLEPPGAGETALRLNAAAPRAAVRERALRWLRGRSPDTA